MTMADLAYYLRISNHLAGNLDIRSALRSVKTEIEQILPLDHLDVCLIDEDRKWNTSYEVGMRTSWSSRRSHIDESPVRDILSGVCETMITGDATADPRYIFEGSASEPILRHHLRSRVNVSMKVLGRTIGSLNCSSQIANIYDENTILQVRNLADVLAPYFYALRATESAKREAVIRTEVQAREEGLRLGALSLTEALEAERQRIGMDLHDQTLADLTRIARDLNAASSRAEIRALQIRMQDCIQGLREIIDMSIPSLLELFGFQHAVRMHLERALGTKPHIKIQVSDNSNGAFDALPETTRTALFRIAQEAINNAVQHADANMISVLIADDAGYWMEIRDDGNAQISHEHPRTTGGLTHMRTRARLIAANFEIANENGTVVRVQLPRRNVEMTEAAK